MIKDIEPLDSTSLNVSWWPLRGVYGELDWYEVSYQPFEVEMGKVETVRFPANATFGILKDLMPDIRYRIRIQAFVKSSPTGLLGIPSAFSFDRVATTKTTGKCAFDFVCKAFWKSTRRGVCLECLPTIF